MLLNLPCVRPDGSRNSVHLQRLKDKLGNRSNASSEIEYDAATGWLVGDEGRGVPTIIEMVNITRLECSLWAAAGMRIGTAQAIHHATHREAFGDRLIRKPAMTNVLADLAVDSEAATTVVMRLAGAVDRAARGDTNERAFLRFGLAVTKYWLCKRWSAHTAEAMECLGGNGYVEESGMPRLYREAPLGSIWEGSGNVAALDALGSEGTLAFITSITMRPVPVLAHTRTGLLVFSDLAEANRALPDLVDSRPATIELLDATSLRVGQADTDADPRLRALTVDEHAALLVEYRGHTADEVDELAGAATGLLGRLPLHGPRELSSDPVAKAGLWELRKGLYAKVAEARPTGTAALLEDIAVPVPDLLATCWGLIDLFGRHGHDDAVIFGHAKDGNVHFMLTERLGDVGGDTSGRDRFGRFNHAADLMPGLDEHDVLLAVAPLSHGAGVHLLPPDRPGRHDGDPDLARPARRGGLGAGESKRSPRPPGPSARWKPRHWSALPATGLAPDGYVPDGQHA